MIVGGAFRACSIHRPEEFDPFGPNPGQARTELPDFGQRVVQIGQIWLSLLRAAHGKSTRAASVVILEQWNKFAARAQRFDWRRAIRQAFWGVSFRRAT